jgi:hypothetical protein
MTQSKNLKEETLKKWAPIIDRMGTASNNWNHSGLMSNTIPTTTSKADADKIYQEENNFGSSLLPIAMKISAKTIAANLVSVQPIGGPSDDKLNEIKKEVKSTNRDRKIDSVIEGKDYEEMKVEDHPDYKKGSMPQGKLFYFDYQYGGTSSNSFI